MCSNIANQLSPWIGPVIIAAIVTFVGQYVLNIITQRQDKQKELEKAWVDSASPVVEAADDLIARYFDAIVRKRKIEKNVLAGDIPNIISTVKNPSNELTTVYRLIRYLACSVYLARQVPKYGHIEKVRKAEFFTANKLRMALKGNVTGSKIKFSTETQHYIGSSFLKEVSDDNPYRFDFHTFLKICEKNKENWDLVKVVGEYLDVRTDITDINNETASLALFLIYLIDLVQDMENKSNWEEFRIMLVSYINVYNKSKGERSAFLYTQKDVGNEDYLKTYPNADVALQKESIRNLRKRINKRQRRGREVNNTGLLRILDNGNHVNMKHGDSPGELLKQMQSII